MKTAIAAIAVTLALVGFTGCGPTQEDRDKQDNAAKELHTSSQQAINEITDHLHQSQLHLVKLLQGEVAASQLNVCFNDDGYDYPRRANLDGTERPINLSNRWIAICDHILQNQERLRAKLKANEKRADDAYDKAHK